MEGNHILGDLFLIFTGGAILSTLVLWTRQSLIVAYMLLGVILGPWGLKLIPNAGLARQIGGVGIIFLLFLLGVELNPHDLWRLLRKISGISILSSLIFFSVSAAIAYAFHFQPTECLIIGAAMMFSSTIIGLKLLPAMTLQHQRIGEVMVSILLLQDLIAIAVMLILENVVTPAPYWQSAATTLLALPAMLLVAFGGDRYILQPLFRHFEGIHEYVFLVAIAWCLMLAKLAAVFNLSEGIGAFIAGVAIAEGPIAHYIANSLRPLRDFFLVLFFFTIGAGFNIYLLGPILLPAFVLAGVMLVLKPWVFKWLLRKSGESVFVAEEAGMRLGQCSEFSILLGAMAYEIMPLQMSKPANLLIQTVTILTFMISCYWVVFRYPTPMSFRRQLKRD